MDMKKIAPGVWEIPASKSEGRNVPARVLSSDELIAALDDGVKTQISNVAGLPGIVKHAICMPDGHWGYGFPIGGVAAFDPENGVISPGGIGFDINCGIRLINTSLTEQDVLPKMKVLMDRLFQVVPCGVGSKGFMKLKKSEFEKVMTNGAKWCIDNGYGRESDLERIEEGGCIAGADPDKVSPKALERGLTQLGTLGSGNHFLEIQVVRSDNIMDPALAESFGIKQPDQVTIMLHCGSRGFGHQIATDYLKSFTKVMARYGISLKDKNLACAPFTSDVGQDYFSAMKCAANSAFANRQVIMHRVREVFSEVFKRPQEELGMHLVYDVAHNIAKLENHVVDGKSRKLLVHRKGATRAFGPGHPELSSAYQATGQPVIVGGSMQTGSYLLVGTQTAMDETFGSTLHGAGRTLSRSKAKKMVRGGELRKKMADDGIAVRAASMSGLAEEAGQAYKDINLVVDAVAKLGISKPVMRMIPFGVLKG